MCQLLPGWRQEVNVRYTPESALTAARDLVAWCREHNQNKPVQRRYNPATCDDEAGHSDIWCVMRYLKDSVAGKTSQPFPAAYKVLDDAFGADAWRPRSGRGCSFVLSRPLESHAQVTGCTGAC